MNTTDRKPPPTHPIAVRFREDELAALDGARGSLTRSEAIRAAVRLYAGSSADDGGR